MVSGCIEPFTPDIDEYKKLLVINGKITDQEGYQYIDISHSTSYTDPEFNFEKGSNVKVYDDKGNVFQYVEYSTGLYRCWFNKEFLQTGTRYRVEVQTKGGKTYYSDFDILEPCPDIDSIYYEVEIKEPDDLYYNPIYGIHLYVDTRESEYGVSNLRWELDETWEYRSSYLVSDYFDGSIEFAEGLFYDTLYYCWKSGRIKDIITLSTGNYSSNKINRGSLAFVPNSDEKLAVRYSALVKQYSLSDSAYQYWNQMQKNLQEAGGLYETQPIRVTGNIHSASDANEMVLGYFWASSVKEKRFFFRNVGEIPLNYYKCQPFGLDSDQLTELLNSFPENDYPIFLINESGFSFGPWDYTDQDCFDCTKKGGTVVRPDFW